ncbi:hypothetical protein FVER14953_13632 [Fusarium verticillioides]|nr:hypothetical protein FVER14953_13632 [Fusarium verticillioides]
MNFLKYCGIGATSGSQQQDQTSELSRGTPAPTHAAPNDKNNNNISALPTGDSEEDKQEDLPQQTETMDVEPDTIYTPAHNLSDKVNEQEKPHEQSEPMDEGAPDTIYTPAHNLSDKVNEQEKPHEQSEPMDEGAPDTIQTTDSQTTDSVGLPNGDNEPAVSPLSANPPLSILSSLRDKPVFPKPNRAFGSSTDQEMSSLTSLGPKNSTQSTETQRSQKATDGKKRKKPPTCQKGNPKHSKKTGTDKKSRSEPIEITSDDESDSDNVSQSDSINNLLDELSGTVNKLVNDENSDNENSDDENSDDEEQMTDDEKHLPRSQKRTTAGKPKAKGFKKGKLPTDEPEEELGEDEAGRLKDGGVPDHIHVGDTDSIVSKGAKPDHNMTTRLLVKEKTGLEEGRPKKEVPIKAFELMIDYAFQTVGLDSAKYPVVFKMAVKYISSTNFFQAKVFSAWGAQKRINTEADLLRATSARYPHYVLTMAPDLILCLIAAIDLRPDAYGEANGRGITIIDEFHVFKYLQSAIELGETISWGKGSRGQLLMLGRRGDHEPVPVNLPVNLAIPKSTKAQTKARKKLPEAIPNPYPANPITARQAPVFMEPYPRRQTLPAAPITKVITAEEWDQRNAHWLDKLTDLESTKDMFGPTIEEEVTEEIFPLISQARRNILRLWAKWVDFDLDWTLLDAPILSQIEVPDETSQGIFDVETDTARRSIRAIETVALSLPKASQRAAEKIKQHTDRLFACRDSEMDNHTIMAQSVAKLRESSSVTAANMNAAFEATETRLQSRVDPAQTARDKALEALEADMANALKNPIIDGPAEELILFLKNHWRMRDGEIEEWKDMANSVCRTAKEAGHPINETDQDVCDNHDWDSLMRLAHSRGGEVLVTLLNMERCDPDPEFLTRRDAWYKETLADSQYKEWCDMYPVGEEPQAGDNDPESDQESSESDKE